MTLTEVSYFSRKFAPFIILIFVVFLIMFYSVKFFFLYSELNKSKIVELNPIFKELKPLEISEATNSAGHTYVFDTIEGEPVTATETAKIFFFPKSQFRFGYKEKMYLMAKSLGFESGITHDLVGKTEAVFADEKRKFRIDITTFNFKYDQDITRSPELFEVNGVPEKETAQNRAVDFLKSFDRYPEGLSRGRMNTIFLRYDKESSKTAVLEDNVGANMIEVDFHRADIDQFPIVSPKYFNSQNYVTMVVTNGDYKVVSARIHFYETSEGQIGLYPVIDGKTAFDKLSSGKGYIIAGSETSKDEVAIKRMFMGYYDPDIYQEYLQPVYVFLGDDNFVSYVPAVTDQYLIDYSKL